ncbi:MAG TPA: N-acetylmuramoyl-L-alanine amidase [Gemmatimonadales bacterium]|nr:N-acetylmuramoyl-L-alanine amidase [Gemmatimonadales bacterium]
MSRRARLAAAVLLALAGAPAVAAAAPIPPAVLVATARGEARVPVRLDRTGAPVLAAAPLAAALAGSLTLTDGWAELSVASRSFRFLLDGPIFALDGQLYPLSATASVMRDSVFVPYQFVAEVLPRAAERLEYDPLTGRLSDRTSRAVAVTAGWKPMPLETGTAAGDGDGPEPAAARAGIARPTAAPTGKLRPGHLVTIDPGHGGVDPGNPGEFFPRGVREKDVTLQVSLLLRDALRARGVAVRMTRTTDTLIALGDRGGYCTARCDLFVSIHVNSLPKRPGYTAVRGFETYFLAEAKTEDAARVARMENEAVRFEATKELPAATGGLDFILKDLQLNEHLRESAQVAELVQGHLGKVHNGPDKGVKQAGFMVLTTARRPAVLVELGYSTNPQDARVMSEPASQRRLAAALADAIVAYLGDYERRTGVAADSAGTVPASAATPKPKEGR